MMKGRPKPGAIILLSDAYGQETEIASFVCKHCGCVQAVPVGKRVEDVTAWCHSCGLICSRCARTGAVPVLMADGTIAELQRCIPFEKRVEYMEALDRNMRELGVVRP